MTNILNQAPTRNNEQALHADLIGDVCTALDVTEDGAKAPLAPKPERACEQCGGEFTPRARSGGSKQRFCGSACRVAFHKTESERSQRSQQTPASGQQTPSVTPASPPPPKPTPEPDPNKFDWITDDSVIIEEQPAVAVYFNRKGGLVIRQQDSWPNDEQIVVITKDNIAAFLDRLTDACGIPGVGRSCK